MEELPLHFERHELFYVLGKQLKVVLRSDFADYSLNSILSLFVCYLLRGFPIKEVVTQVG